MPRQTLCSHAPPHSAAAAHPHPPAPPAPHRAGALRSTRARRSGARRSRAFGPRRIIAVVALTTLSILGGAAPAAFAHDQLESSSPAESAALDTAPTAVTLEYTDRLLDLGAVVLVVDAQDRDWATGRVELDGATVRAPIEGVLPDGAYEVRWRVVSADGHPISGVVPFTVGDADASPRTPTTEPDTSGEPNAAAPSTAAPATDSPGLPAWGRPVLVGVAGATAALLVFGLLTLRRRKRGATQKRPQRPSHDTQQ